ncbi:SPFH domain-containing protein [Catenulispora sp. NF23]|uniref:SPFH domain-containing protein n=1 Tax=Catenulispora pinistramenti TaxID=2705254 RepID=A0ABS5KXP8_9ACTN|nr:SPFH domain-containing protein [Catenulispora pinistramenti]MBS2539465.1 SPFH domain-containing protein [Catenulispora pinistramenti]MBS2550725.1 SPFH domain-containing protein [Catenulispora pinistramenti]
MSINPAPQPPGALAPPAPPALTERPAWNIPGWAPLILAVVAIVVTIAASGAAPAVHAVLIIAAVILLVGLTPVAPGRARVIALFGRYDGTVRTTGLRWVNPMTTRRQVSTRVRNHETATLKVNDADGNPVEIAAVVVWQVRDTAEAVYAVDDFVRFVGIQAETAVRHTATSYPYDARGEGQISLREHAEEITSQMSREIAARVALAGIEVVESRITRLSYAPEIAQVMLRRQQAEAIVAARQRMVQGAVGMVRGALESLGEENIVELDEERKAVMVSNLLVVLCSEQSTQPVVNTGTLYQ